MKLNTILILLLIGLLGCGQVEDDRVYDTDANPDQFPQMAIRLLENVEADRLIGAAAITDAFGELFTEHSDLLDREDWKAVIDRLGLRFGHMADSLKSLGFGSYGLAAEYYQLGAFARPQDTALSGRAKLFACWPPAIDNKFVDLASLTGDAPPTTEAWLNITRYFALGDSFQRQFYRSELQSSVKDGFDPSASGQLPTADRALLIATGLLEDGGLETLASFTGAPIDLVACQIRQFDSSTYRAELFLRPTGEIESELQARVHLEFADKERLVVYFTSLPPVDQWTANQLLAGSAVFEAAEGPARMWVSLYDLAENEYVPFGPEDELFYELDVGDLISP